MPGLVEDELALGHLDSWGRKQTGKQILKPTPKHIDAGVWVGGVMDDDTCFLHNDVVTPRTIFLKEENSNSTYYYDDLKTSRSQVELIWPSTNFIERQILGRRFGVFPRDGVYYRIGSLYYKASRIIKKLWLKGITPDHISLPTAVSLILDRLGKTETDLVRWKTCYAIQEFVPIHLSEFQELLSDGKLNFWQEEGGIVIGRNSAGAPISYDKVWVERKPFEDKIADITAFVRARTP